MKDLIKPGDCKNIQQIRDALDSIDLGILKLFALRQDYVKEIVKYKSSDKEEIIARERKALVLSQRREWAREKGLDPDFIEKVYRLLIEKNIEIQLDINKSNNK